MKVICKKTGITLLTAPSFARWGIASQHPIFDANLETLLTLAATEWSPSLPEQDKKLLLLAIADNCKLLTFSERLGEAAPAMPSLSISEASIQNLLHIASWIDAERSYKKNKTYPSYHVTMETCHLATFPDMLHRIIETRNITTEEEKAAHRLICLEEIAKNLSSKCRVGDKGKEGALLRTTAEWCIAVTEQHLAAERVDASIREDWKQMLQTPASKLKATKYSITDVHELRDFMLEYLPHGSVIAFDVIAHLNRLVECNVINDIESGDIISARIVSAANILNKPEGEADPEPQRAEFKDSLSYAIAKSHWTIRRTQQEQLAEAALKKASLEARAKIAGRAIANLTDDESEI